jgi:hypothetical protein
MLEIILADEDDIEIPIFVEVGNGDILAIPYEARKGEALVADIGEISPAVVQQDHIRLELVGDDDIEIPILVEIGGLHIHPILRLRHGEMGRRGIDEIALPMKREGDAGECQCNAAGEGSTC